MKTKTIRLVSTGFLIALFVLAGCRHLVRTDIDTYLENRQEYKRKRVVLTTDLEDLLNRYELYQNKVVEL